MRGWKMRSLQPNEENVALSLFGSSYRAIRCWVKALTAGASRLNALHAAASPRPHAISAVPTVVNEETRAR
jgi:hypothetical protein